LYSILHRIMDLT